MDDPDALDSVMGAIARWAEPAVGFTFYVFGSRVRGAHRADSDVDLYVKKGGFDDATVRWWCDQNASDFAALKGVLPGRLEIVEEPVSLISAIQDAPPYRTMANVIAVLLPPKPSG